VRSTRKGFRSVDNRDDDRWTCSSCCLITGGLRLRGRAVSRCCQPGRETLVSRTGDASSTGMDWLLARCPIPVSYALGCRAHCSWSPSPITVMGLPHQAAWPCARAAGSGSCGGRIWRLVAPNGRESKEQGAGCGEPE